MIFRSLFFAVCVMLSGTGSVLATPIAVSFEITGFAPSNGNAAPTDPVIGTIIYNAASISSPINSVSSINMTLAGHTYTVSEVGILTPLSIPGGTLIGFGGILNEDGSVSSMTDDFWLRWNVNDLTPFDFVYSSSAQSGIWSTQITQANKFFTKFNVSVVPEPATVLLILLGFVGLLPFRRLRLSID